MKKSFLHLLAALLVIMFAAMLVADEPKTATSENLQLTAAAYKNNGTSASVVIIDQAQIDKILKWLEDEKIDTPAQTGSVRPFLSLHVRHKDNGKWEEVRVIHIYEELDSSGNTLHTTHEQRRILLHLLLWKDYESPFEDYK